MMQVNFALDQGVQRVRGRLQTTKVVVESLLVKQRTDVRVHARFVQLDGIWLLSAELRDGFRAVLVPDHFEGLLPHTTGFSELKCSNLHESNGRGNQ